MNRSHLFPFTLSATVPSLLLSLLLGSAGGCASQPPPMTTYTLETGAVGPRTPVTSNGGVLLIAEPQTEPGFATARMAYIRKPLALEYYTQSSWIDTPARMLQPLLVTALENSRGFAAVTGPATPVAGDVRLDTSVIRLQQEFLTQPSQVRLTVRAKLIDLPTNHILATQVFEEVVPAPTEDAYGGVQAANLAVQRLLDGLTQFVLKYAAERTRRPRG